MLMVTDVQDIIKRHQAQIITSLKDPDIRLHLLSYMLNIIDPVYIITKILNYFHAEPSIYLLVTYKCTFMYKIGAIKDRMPIH